MNEKQQLKLQAYVDGELGGREAHDVAGLLSRDADARALVTGLRHTRDALAGFETEIKLPESREFYWSKIAREIARTPQSRPESPSPGLARFLRRFLLPAGALAALVIAGLWAGDRQKSPGAPEVEVAMADSDPFTYRDYTSGTTLVWLSYPAENDLADLEPDDTLD